MRTAMFATLICGLFACSNQAAIEEEGQNSQSEVTEPTQLDQREATLRRLVAMETKIKTLISVESCVSDTDCATIGIGAKACGGPEYYAVFSKLSTKESELMKQSKAYTLAKKDYNESYGMVSNCMIEPQPLAKCDNNICTLASSRLNMNSL